MELTYPYEDEYFRGVAFSPNSRYLYVTARLDLFQFDFQPWSLELPVSNYAGLPNLPHFSIPDTATSCDTIVATSQEVAFKLLKIFPDPAVDKLHIQTVKDAQQFIIFDLLGAERIKGKIENAYAEIDLSQLVSGVYFISINDREGKMIAMGKVVVR